jgi:protein TonB
MKFVPRCGWLLAVSVLAACQPSSPQADAGSRKSTTDASHDESLRVTGTAEELRQRAALAMREQRVYAPAGDNAVEYFLAARQQQPADADVQSVLVELQPYLLIAAEQALERTDIAESDRLLALIVQVDADAPALPRLRLSLRDARERAALAVQQQAAMMEAPAQAAPSPLSSPSPSAAGDMATAAPPPVASVVPVPSPAMSAAAAVAPSTVEASSGTIADEPVASTAVPAPPRGGASRTPKLLQDAPPRYPLPALRRKVEGQAEVAFTIQPDGSVRNVQLVSSTPAGMFDDSAVAVASRWRFEATGQTHVSRRTVLFRLPN